MSVLIGVAILAAIAVAARAYRSRTVEDGPQTLEEKVDYNTELGYHVESQFEDTVYMVRPKRFSAFWALAWFLVFGVGVLVYVAYYLCKGDERVTVKANVL